MAAKKTRKGKKRRTPAQRAATKKLVALNKSKGKRKKKRKKSKRKHRGYNTGASGNPAHYYSNKKSSAHYMTREGTQALRRPKPPKRRKKRRKHKLHTGVKRSIKHHKKAGGMVTAASILRGARTSRHVAWLCAGPKRTGCGGGKKGGHVVGVLR